MKQELRKVAVIGGGISGLAAAHRLMELSPELDLTLFEAQSRLGGVLESVRQDGFLIERSADGFITVVPWAIDLFKRLGLEAELVPTRESGRKAFVVHKGVLRDIPEGFVIMAPRRVWPLIATPILSPLGKLRMAMEYFIKADRSGQDESIAAFVRRRLGREVYDRLVQPLIGGIYTGNPETLSLASTMPQFIQLETKYGGLIRGTRARMKQQPEGASSGARYDMFMAPREGFTGLVNALAERLPDGAVKLNAPVDALHRDADGTWRLDVSGVPAGATFDAVIVAAPGPAAAGLLKGVHAGLGARVAEIDYAGTVVVSLGFHRDQIAHALNGFGFVVPLVEKRRILAGSFSSCKYPGRADEDHVLIRAFVGGACQPELMHLDDSAMIGLVRGELAELIGAEGTPLTALVSRWGGRMPQYRVGHKEAVAAIQRDVDGMPGLALAGNAYGGVGVPYCIHSGELAAERILASHAS